MAFHVACPFTCRKICYCLLGTPSSLRSIEAKNSFFHNARSLDAFLANPHILYGGDTTVEVLVPRLSKEAKKKKQKVAGSQAEGDGVALSNGKKGVTRRKLPSLLAAEASKADHLRNTPDMYKSAASDQYAEMDALIRPRSKNGQGEVEGVGRFFGNGNGEAVIGDQYYQPLVPQTICGLCTSSETVDSEREKQMLRCRSCSRQYHRKCVKHWAENRDLFNWAEWVCGSCRTCEVCKRSGEPNKLMFCKRCDQALHAYCQQPPLKHVPKGPYLCPKHTRCHSCASNVPGSGVSSRWFMAFTTCDACGRLFMKDKYCPVCLKVLKLERRLLEPRTSSYYEVEQVYRDSEATPMVCCDSCEHWVHCRCDGISDEKFQQFQTDDHLRYKCAACRDECHKVKNVDDAIAVLWKRRDEADVQLRLELRAAAGLPSEEEMRKLCPSDDEKQPPRNMHLVHGPKKPKPKKKGSKDISASSMDKQEEKVRKKSSAQKTTLKILSPSSFAAVEEIRKPKLVITTSKSSKRSTRERADDSSSQTDDIEEGERLRFRMKVSTNEQRSRGPGLSYTSDRETRQDKRTMVNGPSQSYRAVDVDHGNLKSKRLKVVEKEVSPGLALGKVDVWSSTSGRSKNRKAGNAGGVKHRGVIMDSNVDGMGTAELSTSSADYDKEDGGTTEDSEGRANEASASKGLFPLQSWGGHGTSENARRRRLPSSKFRDMEVNAWRSGKGNIASAEGDSESLSAAVSSDAIPQKKGGVLDSRKDGRPKSSHGQLRSNVSTIELDESEALKKRMKAVDTIVPAKHELKTEGLKPKVPLRLKFTKKNEVDLSRRDRQAHEEEEPSTVKGHRSKRRRPGVTDVVEKDELANDNRILQRLGTDAISKRVEVFWPMDNQWYKGTVIGVSAQQAQFSLRYDDGEEETLDFGKERVRLLSSKA